MFKVNGRNLVNNIFFNNKYAGIRLRSQSEQRTGFSDKIHVVFLVSRLNLVHRPERIRNY
ncbi:MAG: hypothetical protein LBK53_07160 [Heliobacteriaceae bacterium]|nr:hypothetical protein [Heliobacteriaceae bacterium]